MKKISPFLLFVFLAITSTANPLNPGQSATLFDHLSEVNQVWNHFYSPDDLKTYYHFDNDRQRIQLHLQLVEKHLRANLPEGLSHQQMRNRNQSLDILKAYYQNASFPENHYHSIRQPYFIDNHGTACAVGHLIIETGFESLAELIAQENNYAYVHELKSKYASLNNWAKAFGFTIDELAWIQPGYPPHAQQWDAVGNGGITEGNIKAAKAFGDEMIYFAGNFSMIDGAPANGIIGWDGTDWHTLGEGVNGTVHDIAIDSEGNVFIGGDFTLNENPAIVNLAYWSDGQWSGFNTQNMTGSIYALQMLNETLYIGGDFGLSYPNMTIQNLAFVEVGGDHLENQNGDFSVDATVNDFSIKENKLIVAGSFSSTASQSNNSSIHQLQTDYLATWGDDPNTNDKNWIQAFDLSMPAPVNAVSASGNKLYVGSKTPPQEEDLGFGLLQDDTWEYDYCFPLESDNDQLIQGFLKHNGITLAYGNIGNIGLFQFIFSSGITILENTSNLPVNGAEFDGPVHIAESFQNQIYFAGDFTSVQGQNFPGLVSSPFNGTVTSSININQNNKLRAFSSLDQIQIQYEGLLESFNLGIYNLSGQLITQKTLDPGSAEVSISTQNWTPGVYVYKAISKSGKMYSGKISVM